MHHNPSYPHTTGQEGEAATKLLIVVSFFLLLCVTRRDPDLAGRSFGTPWLPSASPTARFMRASLSHCFPPPFRSAPMASTLVMVLPRRVRCSLRPAAIALLASLCAQAQEDPPRFHHSAWPPRTRATSSARCRRCPGETAPCLWRSELALLCRRC